MGWYLYNIGLPTFFLSAAVVLHGRGDRAPSGGTGWGDFFAFTSAGLMIAAALFLMTTGLWEDLIGPDLTFRIVQVAVLVGPALFLLGITLGLGDRKEPGRSWKFRRALRWGGMLAGSVVLAGAVLLIVGSFLYAPQQFSVVLNREPLVLELMTIGPAPLWLVVAPSLYRFGLAAFAFAFGILLGTEARRALAGPRLQLPAWIGISAVMGTGIIAFLGGLDVSPPGIPRPQELLRSFPGLPFLVPYLVLGFLGFGIALVLWGLRPVAYESGRSRTDNGDS
ncbi:MAG: hypothetical protein ACE5KI_07330 [Dehalococcoidia bacterium]